MQREAPMSVKSIKRRLDQFNPITITHQPLDSRVWQCLNGTSSYSARTFVLPAFSALFINNARSSHSSLANNNATKMPRQFTACIRHVNQHVQSHSSVNHETPSMELVQCIQWTIPYYTWIITHKEKIVTPLKHALSCSTAKLTAYVCRKSVCNTVACQKLKGKNDGKVIPALYDRPHDNFVSIVIQS